MYFEYKEAESGAVIRLTDNIGLITDDASLKKGLLHIIINETNQKANFWVEDQLIALEHNQLTTCTYLHSIKFQDSDQSITVVSFNRDFYCIMDHDHEVSCQGVLFLGAQGVPIIDLNSADKKKINTLMEVFKDEFLTKDRAQGEMLQMLLKRLIIICTRIARDQLSQASFDHTQIDIIRRYNLLVEMHFRSLKKVQDYADLLHKSPKTLSNLFRQRNAKSPLLIIHERIVAEARRKFKFTDKSAKEVAYDLGFDDAAAFARTFKKVTGLSPLDYKRKMEKLGS